MKKKAAIGMRNIPIPRNGRPSASEIRKAIPIGESKRKKEKPIAKNNKSKKYQSCFHRNKCSN